MANKVESIVALERQYVIPLRKEFLKVPKYKRAKKATTAVKEFLIKHMKTKTVKIGKFLNESIWKNGIKNPPHHVKVIAKKNSEGIVTVELFTTPKVKESKRKIKDKLVSKKEITQEGGALEDKIGAESSKQSEVQSPKSEEKKEAKQSEVQSPKSEEKKEAKQSEVQSPKSEEKKKEEKPKEKPLKKE